MWSLFGRHLREQPHAEAVADAPNRADFAHGAPRRLTWAQLGGEIDRFCLLLSANGIRRDDVVVVQMPNCVEQFVAYLACARLGVIVTPVPIQYREHELGHILDVTRARAAVTFSRIGKPDAGHAAARMFAGLREAHPSLQVGCSHGAMRSMTAWSTWLRPCARHPRLRNCRHSRRPSAPPPSPPTTSSPSAGLPAPKPRPRACRAATTNG